MNVQRNIIFHISFSKIYDLELGFQLLVPVGLSKLFEYLDSTFRIFGDLLFGYANSSKASAGSDQQVVIISEQTSIK